MHQPADGAPAPAVHTEIKPVRSRRAWNTSLLIGLCCFVIYNANLRSIPAGDTYPARYLPFAIVQYHTVFLDPVERVASQGRGAGAYWMVRIPGGHIVSLYPVTGSLLVAPLYIPAVGYLHLRGWDDARLDHVAKVMEKLAASFVAALSAALLHLLLLRRTTPRVALLLTLAYALGTTTWVISSQALWQHGMAELLVIGTLLVLTGPCTMPRVLAAGLLLGLIGANRPPDIFIAAALGVYGLFWAGRRLAVLLTAVAAAPMVATLLYNLAAAGNIGGGYGLIGKAKFFEHDLLTGVTGLLFSPAKGLLIYSPFLLFLGLAWRHWPRERDERRLTLAMIAAIVIQILLYAKADWRGGLSWGPRYMTDLLPLFIWMLVPVAAALRGAGKAAFQVAVGLSIAMQAVGAFAYLDHYDLPVHARDRGAEYHDMGPVFDWRNAAYLTALRQGFAPAELAVLMRGRFDAVESGGRPTTVITAGQEASLTGWALANGATPSHVAVTIDGRQTVIATTFFDRPDVRGARKTANPAGWRIPLETASLTPGEHRLTAFAWASSNGSGHLLGERTLTVQAAPGIAPPASAVGSVPVPADLLASAGLAIARLREHQQADGSWLTAYTSGTRFLDPRPEMNTFMTALLVDLLDPVAADARLDDNVQRARRHLTAQVEPGGLMRYHGLPDGPGIGTLGCAITPDTDNTALVWRLAPPPDRERLTAALATIDQYRTPDGLYRTWLAPRAAYQCLDPGRDPNPADIVIQMHLLQLLAAARPPAAQALCDALRPVVDEDRVWVYYRKTPLLASLREPELRRAGCALDLPASRTRTEIAEQRIWVTVVQLLTDGLDPSGPPPDAVLVRAALRELARDDFALLRAQPPLLFHNDLTASVSRYYWSEDVGYAFWLRLLDVYARPRAR